MHLVSIAQLDLLADPLDVVVLPFKTELTEYALESAAPAPFWRVWLI
jgi:hypothetical protein